mmetsp:Transcript_12867/g.36068  ORF Transcript_12867/g.36068 Transcript_12867/m.36068 type:complete len:286 (+) Transcript_12867:1943-2800(+)
MELSIHSTHFFYGKFNLWLAIRPLSHDQVRLDNLEILVVVKLGHSLPRDSDVVPVRLPLSLGHDSGRLQQPGHLLQEPLHPPPHQREGVRAQGLDDARDEASHLIAFAESKHPQRVDVHAKLGGVGQLAPDVRVNHLLGNLFEVGVVRTLHVQQPHVVNVAIAVVPVVPVERALPRPVLDLPEQVAHPFLVPLRAQHLLGGPDGVHGALHSLPVGLQGPEEVIGRPQRRAGVPLLRILRLPRRGVVAPPPLSPGHLVEGSLRREDDALVLLGTRERPLLLTPRFL